MQVLLKNEITIEEERARLARWFSKDGQDMPVYYDRKGYARPVTRDEQDRWLAEGHDIISEYAQSSMATSYLATCLLAIYAFFILPEILWKWPTAGGFSIPVAMALFVALASKTLVQYRVRLRRLRSSIEDRLHFRNPVIAAQKRFNAFAWFGRCAGVLAFVIYGLIMLNNTKLRAMLGSNAEVVYFSLFLTPLCISALGLAIMRRVDKAHIRQTGVWFRWPRR